MTTAPLRLQLQVFLHRLDLNSVFLSCLTQVAEQLINPFGEDDDDFETNWLVDRNLQVCAQIHVFQGELQKLRSLFSSAPSGFHSLVLSL